jgi:hypothetical protein
LKGTSIMNTFRQRDGDRFVEPPFGVEFEDVFVLVLQADSAKLQAICDNDLNVGPERFQPLGDFVILYGARIKNLSEGTRTCAREVGFWVPVSTERNGITQIFTYTPYVWLSSATSTRVGRALYGYPKHPGDVVVSAADELLELSVRGEVLVSSGPESFEMVERTIVSARPATPAIWKRPETHGLLRWVALGELMAQVTHELLALPTIEVRDLVQVVGGMRSIFLRQLPGVESFSPPAYQALIEAAITPDLSTVCAARLHDARWDVTIPLYPEPKVADTLGLSGTVSPDGQNFMARSIGEAWQQFAGRLEAGKEIWRAG